MVANAFDKPENTHDTDKTQPSQAPAGGSESHSHWHSRLTKKIVGHGIKPNALLERGHGYLARRYADLAVGDAYVSLTIAEAIIDGEEFDVDLEDIGDRADTITWAFDLKLRSMDLIVSGLIELNCLQDVSDYLSQLWNVINESNADSQALDQDRALMTNQPSLRRKLLEQVS